MSEIVDFDKNCQRQIQSVIRAKEIQKLGSESQSRVEFSIYEFDTQKFGSVLKSKMLVLV